jgi:sialidase-1
MINIFKILFVVIITRIIFFPITGGLYAQETASSIVKVSNSQWKGFARLDFIFDQKKARLIVPENPHPGKPWVWRARFPDWHTETDSILTAEGFHIAYINTDNMFGSPSAMKTWDKFYEFLTERYALNEKVVLEGVSRGGLFIYNWAKNNPGKVSCIYAEAPVCDFKSWPAGFGEGKSSKNDWKVLKREYGFETDVEAKDYADNPIDNLGTLAKYGVPILHMISLTDKIVPPAENTFRLVDTYRNLGGPVTVIPCTKGEQKLEGHHFEIETPQLVADFIKYHTLKEIKIQSGSFHQVRSGLQNSQIRFEKEKFGRVAFLGGSITYNSGWRDSICAYLVKRFPETEFEFINAGIPSMGSTPAAFRLERDVLSKGRVDLLFEEAAVNDASNGRTSIEQIRAMEGIVRHLRYTNPGINIVLMHFVDLDKINDYNNGETPAVIQSHEKVAKHYNLPTINLAREVTERIRNKEFNWEDDFKNLHPSPFGQGVYARSMTTYLEQAFSDSVNDDARVKNSIIPEKLDGFCYDKGKLIDITKSEILNGWRLDPSWTPDDKAGVRSNYHHVPMLVSEQPGSLLKFRFNGKAIGIAVASGPDAGIIEYRIDEGDWQFLNLYTPWSMHLHLPWYYTLSAELPAREHILELRTSKMKDESSTGHACRIRYFFINED